MKITRISPPQAYPLRHAVLRPHQSLEACKYPADFEKDSFHLGAFIGESLISVASFYQEDHPKIVGTPLFRLRGMATLPDYRNQGAGAALIREAEKILEARDASGWWCNARTTVSQYYEKMGMEAVGEVFEIVPIGPHRLMKKAVAR